VNGLAVCVTTDGSPLSVEVLDRLRAAAPHELTDGVTQWREGPAGMIRFHHATTPEARGERQPLTDSDGALTLCFDGRLDNRASCLSELAGRADVDARSTDAAIVLALFGRFGAGSMEKMTGDFALALWDAREGRLLCARSPAGWRPLLWCRHNGMAVFATEPRTLIAGLGLSPKLNEGAIGEYLSMRFVSHSETFWQGMSRVPPGSALSVQGDEIRAWHWHSGPFPESDELSDEGHVAKFNDLFDAAICSTTRSSTAVAAHLSGGLDSSSVVARATRLQRGGRISVPLFPVSARFPGRSMDETQWSGAVEHHLGITAQVVTSTDYAWEEHEDWTARTLHLPLRPNTTTTIVAACERIRAEGIRVLLTGEGGDDWLTGSRAQFSDLLRQGRIRQLFRQGLTIADPSRPLARRLASIVRDSAMPLFSRAMRARLVRAHLDFSEVAPEWVRPGWAQAVSLSDRWRNDRAPVTFDRLWQQQRYRPFAFARRYVNVENVVSFMASRGIEMRHPLHDRKLAEYLLGIPAAMLLRAPVQKYLLRAAMGDELPGIVSARRSKADFSPLIAEHVVRRYADADVGNLEPVRRGWLEKKALLDMLGETRAWRDSDYAGRPPMFGPLWTAIAMDVWLRRAFRG
jgi:asparagine synthase (glutamine-hydrolysing)